MKLQHIVAVLVGGLLFAAAAQTAFSQSQIDRQPLIDAAASARSQGVDWTKPFDVEMTGTIGRDGRLASSKFVRSSGDAKTVAAMKRFVSAVGGSGWLGYLSSQGIENVRVRVTSNAQTFALNASAPQSSAQRAQTMSAGFANLLAMALNLNGRGGMKLDPDEELIIRGIRATAAGKNVNISLALPAASFRRMATK